MKLNIQKMEEFTINELYVMDDRLTMDNDILQSRLKIMREKLMIIERALDDEVLKDWTSRRKRKMLMLFLHHERAIYTNIVSELNTLAEEADDKTNIK